MQREFEFGFDEAFIRNAMRRDMIERGLIATGLLTAAGLAACLLDGFDWAYVAIMGTGIAVVWALLLRVLRKGAQRVLEFWTQQSPEGVVRWRLEEDAFQVQVGTSSSRYAWQGLRRLWRYPDVWIVEIVKNLSVFLPPDALDDETRAYIEERCRNAGVRV